MRKALVAAAMAVTIAVAFTGVAQAQNGNGRYYRQQALPTALGLANLFANWPFRNGGAHTLKIKLSKFHLNKVAVGKHFKLPPIETGNKFSGNGYHYKKFKHKKVRFSRTSDALANYLVGTAFCAAGSTLIQAIMSSVELPGQVVVNNLASCVFPPYGIYLLLGGQPIFWYDRPYHSPS